MEVPPGQLFPGNGSRWIVSRGFAPKGIATISVRFCKYQSYQVWRVRCWLGLYTVRFIRVLETTSYENTAPLMSLGGMSNVSLLSDPPKLNILKTDKYVALFRWHHTVVTHVCLSDPPCQLGSSSGPSILTLYLS